MEQCGKCTFSCLESTMMTLCLQVMSKQGCQELEWVCLLFNIVVMTTVTVNSNTQAAFV